MDITRLMQAVIDNDAGEGLSSSPRGAPRPAGIAHRVHIAGNASGPTFGSVLGLIMAGPTPPPPLIDTPEACNHLRKHLQVRGTVTQIGANRRGDVILRFGSAQADFKAVIPASCVLSKEGEWIKSLKNRKLTVSGLISFYAQAPAMRILEKDQVSLVEE